MILQSKWRTIFRESIDSIDAPPPDYIVPEPTANLEQFSLVSVEEVHDIIRSSSNARCPLNPILTWLVKECVDELMPIITNMINSCLEIGPVPDNWKVALIAPLLKKIGLELVNQNFCPVSNLLLVWKTAEKAVIPQLLAHCTEHAPLPTKAWFPYDRPDRPSRLKKCSDDRDDQMEMLPRRSQTTQMTETTWIAWIELSSIRTIGTIV